MRRCEKAGFTVLANQYVPFWIRPLGGVGLSVLEVVLKLSKGDLR